MGTFPVHELAKSPLVMAPFHTLVLLFPIPTFSHSCIPHSQSQLDIPSMLYEAATDSICSMLYVCEDVAAYFPLATALKSHVGSLIPLFRAAIQIEDSDRWAGQVM